MPTSRPDSVVGVCVEAPQHAGLASWLDYTSEQPLLPGTIVRVPLGKRDVAGIVWHVGATRADEGSPLRPIRQALCALDPLSPAWRQLVGFSATYYQRHLGELALAVLPPELRRIDATQLARRLASKALAEAAGPADATAPDVPGARAPDMSDGQVAAV